MTAEAALREIVIALGNPDPADGEGIAPEEVWAAVTVRLAAIEAALDSAGCAVGNEHQKYSTVERIQWLHTAKDYAFRKVDELREFRRKALTVTTQATIDHIK